MDSPSSSDPEQGITERDKAIRFVLQLFKIAGASNLKPQAVES